MKEKAEDGVLVPPEGYETKMRIIRAIVDLGSHTTVSNMTVRAICIKAGISRQTFYRHFIDKYDALAWYNQQQYRELMRVGRDLSWEDAGLSMLVRTYDNRDFYAIALRSSEDYNSLLPATSRLLYRQWKSVVESFGDASLTPKLDFQLGAWSKLGPQLVMDWVMDGCSTPVHEFWEYTKSCVPCDMRDVMDAHVQKIPQAE